MVKTSFVKLAVHCITHVHTQWRQSEVLIIQLLEASELYLKLILVMVRIIG